MYVCMHYVYVYIIVSLFILIFTYKEGGPSAGITNRWRGLPREETSSYKNRNAKLEDNLQHNVSSSTICIDTKLVLSALFTKQF